MLIGLSGQIREARAQGHGDVSAGDLKILNVALGLEHEAIAAYQAGAESGLLEKPVLDVAVCSRRSTSSIAMRSWRRSRRRAACPSSRDDRGLRVAALASQKDVLVFAARLEAGAASAYLGALKAIENKDYLIAAASIMGNETQHLALLRQVLGENPVPSAFIS